jgi:hypothetical protein
MIPKEINLKDKKFQSQYYVSGHYDFQIEVEYENGNKETITRRYSEIRALYKTLILRCPGCLIPDIPSKSIWLKINYGNEDQITERMAGIQEFFSHIAHHKILSKNKYVINFFSKNYKGIDNNNNKASSSTQKKKDDSDDEEDLNFGQASSKDENEDKNDVDDDDIEPLDEYVEEYNNKNKGIVSKGKKLIGNIYNKAWSYVSSNNKNEGEKEENNENEKDEKNSILYKKLSNEDFEFIKKKTKELGEDFDINDYNEKINRLNEGVKNLIQNFEKLSEIHKKNTQALQNIVNNDNNIQKLNKEAEKAKENNIDDDEDNCESNKINHKSNIAKIKNYCTIQRSFIEEKFENNIKKIKNHQKYLQELLDIYSRKKEHLNYLGRLHSQKDDIEKQKTNSGKEDPLIKKKVDELEEKLNHEIRFIKKMNKDLKYEIEFYKDNKEEDIYININSVFKDKAENIKNCINNLNKEINIEEEEKNEESSKKSEFTDKNKGDDF